MAETKNRLSRFMSWAMGCILLGATAGLVGCIIEPSRSRHVVVEEEAPAEIVEVEPPPVERVYIYERGYPPGVYYYNGYYYEGHRRYQRNVYITKVVNVNVQRNNYVNIEENRREGHVREQRQVEQYSQTGRRNSNVAHTDSKTAPPSRGSIATRGRGAPDSPNSTSPNRSGRKSPKDSKDDGK